MILLKVNINKKTHMSFRVLLKIGMPVQNGILNILEMVTCDKITPLYDDRLVGYGDGFTNLMRNLQRQNWIALKNEQAIIRTYIINEIS